MNNKVITLIRFATVAPQGDVGTEPTPPIGLAYLAAMCNDIPNVKIKGIDASGRDLYKFFDIPEYNIRGNGYPRSNPIMGFQSNIFLSQLFLNF